MVADHYLLNPLPGRDEEAKNRALALTGFPVYLRGEKDHSGDNKKTE